MRRLRWALALTALAFAGCIAEEPAPGSDDAAGGAGGGTLDGSTGGQGGEGGEGGQGGGAADEGVPPDAGRQDGGGRDMARPDMAVPPIEACQAACDRFAACERLDVWGDEGACLDACERSGRGGDLGPWFECLEVEACGLLQLCRLPAPPALSCAEVCATAEGCEVALPFADCEAECEAFPERAALSACAETLTVACDVAGFGACLAADVFPECGARCERTQACRIEGDTCLSDCVAAGLDADPLRRQRQGERTQCVRFAGEDCERINQCLNPEAGPVGDEATFCRAWDRCYADFAPCEIALQEFLPDDLPNRAAVLACGVANLQQCQEDPFFLLERCFDGGGPVGPTCLDLCNVQQTCGQLPAEFPNAIACNQACQAAQQQDPDAAARIALQLPCALAERCDELAECVGAASPDAACDAYCGALDACGAGSAECAATCDARFFRQRDQAARECVAAAGGDCAAVVACQPTPAVGCEALCARQAECARGEPQGRCLAACDDADFADPEANLAAIACALTAPVCDDGFSPQPHAVNRCVDGGRDCLGWCRRTTECAGEGDLVACLDACGAGIPGSEGAERRIAEACYADASGAGCPALAACVPDEAPCQPWCDALEGCGLADEGCVEICGADPLAQVQAHAQSACVAAAAGDCEAVAACAGIDGGGVEPPVDTSEANFCRLYNGCGLGQEIQCDEFYNIFAQEGGEASVACMIRTMEAACPAFEFDLFEQCLEQRELDPRRAECEQLCQARALCDELAPGDLRTCRAACVETFTIAGNDQRPDQARRLEAELPCADARSCPALAECRGALAPEAQCATHCEALVGCGLEADADACGATCDDRFGRLRDTAWRACVRAAGADCEAVAACAPAATPDCRGWCRELAQCGFNNNADCEAACDDDHFTNPAEQALRLACAQNVQGCFNEGRPGGASLEDCVFGDPTVGLDPGCEPYCLTVTECAEGAERAFDQCIVQCAEGFRDEEGLTYGAARGCAVRLGPQARCADLVLCLPPEPPAIDCEAQCGALDACGVAPEGCVAACEAGGDRDEAGCVSEAARAERGCGALAACVGFEAPPVPPACERLCARREACDAAVDGFTCRLACSPAPEGLGVRAACAEVTRCDRQAACEVVGALDGGCVGQCVAIPACGGPDAATCAERCSGYRSSPDTDADADRALLTCLGEAGDLAECGAAYAACFDSLGTLCDEACVFLAACGFVEGDQCGQECRQAAAEDPIYNPDSLRCMIEGLQNNRCDPEALQRCFDMAVDPEPGEPPPLPDRP